jgi:hypothetical protein
VEEDEGGEAVVGVAVAVGVGASAAASLIYSARCAIHSAQSSLSAAGSVRRVSCAKHVRTSERTSIRALAPALGG